MGNCQSLRANMISDTICLTVKDSILEALDQNPKKFISSIRNDKCLLSFLESLGNKAIITRQRRYLYSLNTICQISDGYLGDGIGGVASEIFEKDPFFMIEFFLATRHRPCLYFHLIDEMSATVAVSTEDQQLQRIVNYHERIRAILLGQTKKKKYLNFLNKELILKINPAKFN